MEHEKKEPQNGSQDSDASQDEPSKLLQTRRRPTNDELQRLAQRGEGKVALEAARKLRNRISAQKSRSKKRRQEQQLESEVDQLKRQLAEKDKIIEEKERHIASLKKSIAECPNHPELGVHSQQHPSHDDSSSQIFSPPTVPLVNPQLIPENGVDHGFQTENTHCGQIPADRSEIEEYFSLAGPRRTANGGPPPDWGIRADERNEDPLKELV
eukprot:gb/GECG01002555.1/.p1 GENE.gb/GECG01002555.1/~~gb/GECG01002555.1/.p1  ORF type:complete len:212 (+),score=43.14 gb/GECG01002555.1/:1-636(+)